MTPKQRRLDEEQIKNNFLELQKKLDNLKSEVQGEIDDIKKQEKNEEIKKLEKEEKEIESLINRFSQLQEEEVQALKTRLEEYRAYKQEVLDVRQITPTTHELLKDSETCNRLRNIIESNPKEFKNIPGDSVEKKLDYIFTKIRNNVVLFMKNKLGNSPKIEYVINNTITPAFERSLMEFLRDQGNETNVDMLQGMDKISFDSFNKLVKGVSKFAQKTTGSYNKFSQWINALDYLSVHNGILRNPNKSEVLSNPLKFKEYMNDVRFSANGFSPYTSISDNIFKIDENQTFEFGISETEKQAVLAQIGNIQVVNSPKTTALIAGMLDKPEKFLQKTEGLQKTANSLLDGVNSLNSVTKIFGVDILGDITKAPEKRGFLYRIIDFVCKLIGITGGLEGIVKKWRMDRMNLIDEKNENISQIFVKYKKLAGDNAELNITEGNCKEVLSAFAVTDSNTPSTKGDFLRDSIAESMDVSLISPVVVQQAVQQHKLGNSLDYYLKKETISNKNGKTEEKFTVDESKFTADDKLQLANSHLILMKAHLENYKNNDLSEFYKNIHSTEDLALCITASLYADPNDVIEGVKAKVFLPENYGSVRSDGTVGSGRDNLDSGIDSDKQKVSEQWIYDKAVEYGVTDKHQIAYILSTLKGESGFKNQKEIKTEKTKGKEYWKEDGITRKAYYGRGFIQLTWKDNYQEFTNIIQSKGKDFEDNDGNILKASDINLVKNPDIILKSNELAIFIAIHGMKNGLFTGKKLDDFINDRETNYVAARKVVNGSDRANEFANNAQSYLNRLDNGESLA